MLIPIAAPLPAPDPMDGEPPLAQAVPPADISAWPAPDMRLLSSDLPPAPPLPLDDVLSPRAAAWVAATADGAGAPADYVLAGLLAVASAAIGNARWVTIWPGWSEPPTLWAMAIGNPSAGKSPAIASALAPLEAAERPLRREAENAWDGWEKSKRMAEVKAEAWKAAFKAALKQGTEPPELPDDALAGDPPHLPRLVIRDATVEKIGTILHAQPRGALQFRDELAGWLKTMEARNSGADRAFWLEATGGRGFTVDRMSRASVYIPRLAIAVVGGIQPDRLRELLTSASDDGLLARFLPVWPDAVPLKRPEKAADPAEAERAVAKLMALDMPTGEDGDPIPWFAPLDEAAQDAMDTWRSACRAWEAETSGLLLSYIGKLPGQAARLALVLAGLEHAFDGAPQPNKVEARHFLRACHFLEAYALPMARRAYAGAGIDPGERAGRALLRWLIQSPDKRAEWMRFTTREAMRGGSGLNTSAKLNPAIKALLEADVIRPAPPPIAPQGGRPLQAFDINPGIFECAV